MEHNVTLTLKSESWFSFLKAKAVTVTYRESQQKDFQSGYTPEDIANAVAFLVDDKSGWITGETLSVNGGQLME